MALVMAGQFLFSRDLILLNVGTAHVCFLVFDIMRELAVNSDKVAVSGRFASNDRKQSQFGEN